MNIILGITAGICAFGWLNSWVARAALIKYMTDENTLPSEEQIKACVMWAWKKLLHAR